MTPLQTATWFMHGVLAGNQPGDDTGGQGPDFGKASPIALLLLLVLLVAVVLLVRSMTKHLRKVPASFDEPTDEDRPDKAKADNEDTREN